MDANTRWAVVKNGTAEVIGSFSHFGHAETLHAALGDGYTIERCAPDTGLDVLHIWECAAQVDDGELDVWPPFPIAGSFRLVSRYDDFSSIEKVVVDEESSQLATIVDGRPIYRLKAYATSADRARQLATEHAEALAQKGDD